MATTRRRVRWTQEEARRILAEAARSGLSLTEYARKHDLPVKKLWSWQARLGPTRRASGRRKEHHLSGGLLELRPVGAGRPSDAPGLELVLANGRRLCVPLGYDAEELLRIVTLLESC
jgi:transposase-like protein